MKDKNPPAQMKRIFPQLENFQTNISIMHNDERTHSMFEAKMRATYPGLASGIIHRAAFLFIELKQNAERHSKSTNIWYGASFEDDHIQLMSVNPVTDSQREDIQSETDIMQHENHAKIRDIIRERNQSFSAKGTGILQMFLKASYPPEFIFQNYHNTCYVLTKIVLYVKTVD